MNVINTPNREATGFLLIQKATTLWDRWLMMLTALIILLFVWQTTNQSPGKTAIVYLDNKPLLTLSLAEEKKITVNGHLGMVEIQIQSGKIRLLEYASQKLIGTRTGWIYKKGSLLACVPCGIVIKVTGISSHKKDTEKRENLYDGIAR